MVLEVIGTLIGLVYLWLEYKANILVWIAGIVMPAIYMFVYFEAGLYADFAINIYYCMAAIYGLVTWCLAEPGGIELSDQTPNIIHTPRRQYPVLAIVAAMLFVLIGLVLKNCTDSTVPWYDSFTTALSIVAMYMLAHKHAEQWLVWVVVDAACCALYFYKGLYPTCLLYALYAVIAVFGYRKWTAEIREQNP